MRSLAEHSQCIYFEADERNKIKILLRFKQIYDMIWTMIIQSVLLPVAILYGRICNTETSHHSAFLEIQFSLKYVGCVYSYEWCLHKQYPFLMY